jgi:hypothetical protein
MCCRPGRKWPPDPYGESARDTQFVVVEILSGLAGTARKSSDPLAPSLSYRCAGDLVTIPVRPRPLRACTDTDAGRCERLVACPYVQTARWQSREGGEVMAGQGVLTVGSGARKMRTVARDGSTRFTPQQAPGGKAGPVAFTEYSVNTCAARVGGCLERAQSRMGLHRELRKCAWQPRFATNALERTAATNLNGDVRNGYESQGN